jgi:CRISPR type III-A/MTUBE-associated protein Csm6
MSVLFSPLGKSDPISNLHDGAALHIIRHYPDITHAYFFLTKQIVEKHEKDNIFVLAFEDFKKRFSRNFEFEFILSEIDNPQDFNISYDIFLKELERIYYKHSNEKIILNVSSGTPQMKMNLCLLASQNKIPYLIPIQVDNPAEGKMASETTDNRKYDIELQIALNEDNNEGAKNRCSEVTFLTLMRERKIDQISKLIETYNYSAVIEMIKDDIINQEAKQLLFHLKDRRDNKLEESKKHLSKETYHNIKIFPSKTERVRKLVEYLLIIKILQRNNQITDMYYRLNNLIIALQKAFITDILRFQLNNITFNRRGIENLSAGKIESYAPLLYKKFNEVYKNFQDDGLSIRSLNIVIDYIVEKERITDEEQLSIVKFFNDLDGFSSTRNLIVHELESITEGEFKKKFRFSTKDFVIRLEEILKYIYPKDVKDSYLEIYDNINSVIKKLL